MKYTVIWKPATLDRLAEFFLRALEGGHGAAAIRQAVVQIDRELLHDPETVGESRAGNQRVFIASPLTITFVVTHADRMVTIVDVRYYPRPLP